jgi:8-oxo-dGTP pyrophosphatase MutT (NUDIX family)
MSTLKKWKLLSRKNISQSKWFPLYQDTVQLPNGKIVDDYITSQLGDVVMVLALTPQKEIIFVRQYKHGVEELIMELPAGRIKHGQAPEMSAHEELKEETGFVVDTLLPLGFVCPMPSKDPQKTYGFLATEVQVFTGTDFDDNEDIEVILVPMHKVLERVKIGEIYGSDTMALLFKAQLLYPEKVNLGLGVL